MDQTFTDYLTNKLSDKFSRDLDFKIKSHIKESKIERQPKKLPRFINHTERDTYDLLIDLEQFAHPRWQKMQVRDAIIKFKSQNENVKGVKLINDIDIVVRKNAEKLAIQELLGYEINERDVRNYKYLLTTEDGASVLKTTKKRLFKKQRFLQESIALHAGLISKNGMKRCTTWQLQNRKNKHIDDAEWSKKTVITNGKDTFSLATAGHTRSKKLAELYAFSKGIETVAQGGGMVWASVVCTVPPQMHPAPANGNGSWDGTLPNESSDFLQKNWALTRAALAKYDITLSGLWTREAHSDGTPHINFMLYFNEEDKEQVQRTFNDYFEHSDKAIKWQDGGDVADGKKAASFASYAYKYFAKFISEDEMPSDEILCEEAWASAFSLRRYDFFGIPSRSQWRSERAKREKPSTYSKLLKDSWKAARDSDAAEWIKLNGGLGKKKKDRPIKVISEFSQSGKSRIAVGVEEKATGANFISKKIGEWTLQTLKSALNALNVVKKSSENKIIKTVTLDLSYPSKPKKQNQIIQKVFEITHPPPLLQ